MIAEVAVRRQVAVAGRRALGLGLAGSALAALGGVLLAPEALVRSYLVGYVFWLGIAIGALGLALIHALTGGQWGRAIGYLLEAAARTVPWLALGFLPIALALPVLYPWATAHPILDATIAAKRPYLNMPFFLVRAATYFAVWWFLAVRLSHWSRARDRSLDPAATARLSRLGAAGLIPYGLAVTFAAIDWLMSLEPRWYSTIFGGLVGVSWLLSALAFVVTVAVIGGTREPLVSLLTPKVRIDLGNLLLTFVVLWAYFHFAQYLVIWTGNVPEEASWYVKRLTGGWELFALAVALGVFLGPLLVLLSRSAKQRRRVMAPLAGWLVVATLLAMFWLVMPAFSPGRLTIHWLDPLTPIGLGGLWTWRFFRELERRPLVALGDPAVPAEANEYAWR